MAGLFGFFNFEKEGAGVNPDTPKKKRPFLFFELYQRKIINLIQLNLLYILFCLPVITIGPATAGFTYVLKRYGAEEHSWIWSDFIEHFKKNFRQGFCMGAVNLIVFILLLINYLFLDKTANFGFLKYTVLAIAAIFIMMQFFTYGIMIKFNMKLIDIYKDAFILTVVRLWSNFLILILILALLYVYMVICSGFYYIIILVIPMFSTIGFIITFYAQPIIDKYLLNE